MRNKYIENNVHDLNICLVAEEYPEDTGWGGIGTYHYHIARGLSSIGCRVFVIARGLKKETIQKEGSITLYRILPFFERNKLLAETIGYRLAVYKKLKEIIKKHKIDIIDSPEWKAETVFYHIFDGRVPTCVRMEGSLSVVNRYNNIKHSSFIQKIQYLFEKWMVNNSVLVTSCSKSLINEERVGMNIKRNDIEVIPNPTSIQEFSPSVSHGNTIRSFLSIRKDQHIVLYTGRIEKRKGVDLLFKTIPKICTLYPDTKFIFIGRDTKTGKDSSSFKRELIACLEPRLRKNILFVGYVPHSKLAPYYNCADICIFPSLYEPFGNVCIEAMSCGKAVIASNNGGMAEIIDHNTSGILFKTGNQDDLERNLIVLIKNKKNRERLGASARRKIEKYFDRKIIAEKLLKKYKNAIYSNTKR